MNIQRQKQNGFTLIEILVAISILSLVMMSVYTIVHNGVTSRDRTISEDRDFLQMETALNRLEFDFMQMYSPLFFEAFNQDKEAPNIYNDSSERFKEHTVNRLSIPIFDSQDKNTLIFMTNSNRRKRVDSKQSNFVWVKYSLERNEDEPDIDNDLARGDYNLVRYYDTQNIFDNQFNWDKSKPQILMKSIKSLKFSFWDNYDKKYVSSVRELKKSNDIIRSIRVTIEYFDIAGIELIKERTFRVVWPFFETALDEEEKTKAKKSSRPSGDRND